MWGKKAGSAPLNGQQPTLTPHSSPALLRLCYRNDDGGPPRKGCPPSSEVLKVLKNL